MARCCARFRAGLIPAWAGKTTPPPHHEEVARGSSPRGRGKPMSRNENVGGGRLIPAWAGKTSGGPRSGRAAPAHPRVGGENQQGVKVIREDEGSSPRGRGKLEDADTPREARRLIPAWAGKTGARGCNFYQHEAHPRVGGENVAGREAERLGAGSSPRGRGKRLLMVHLLDLQRLIPAWAGKTPGAARRWMEPTAHPRVGGENGVIDMVAQDHAGSSPRGRGKRHRLPRPRLLPRLIPAWAGKTGGGGVSTELESAHPRVGGENVAWATVGAFGTGSSPRGRGKREGIPPLVKW